MFNKASLYLSQVHDCFIQSRKVYSRIQLEQVTYLVKFDC